VGTELFHADGRTDMTKLTVAFRNIANALKNGIFASFKLYRLHGNIICNNEQRSELFISSTVLGH